MTKTTYLLWRDGNLSPTSIADGDLLAADSWLVDDGYCRGNSLHFGRFAAACGQYDIGRDPLEPFWRAAIAALPKQGQWFPRVELRRSNGEFMLGVQVRAAPPRSAGVRIIQWRESDPRLQPRTKGPDIETLQRIRAAAISRGADEAVLTSDHGVVLEGATTSIVWWEDDVLCAPPFDLPILCSVTREIVFDIARRNSVATAFRARRFTEVVEHPIWALNALHGVREVVEVVGADGAAKRSAFFDEWRRLYADERKLLVTGALIS
jgi:branched-subunit amino acid aminotransferase/4-amino-4-deoxychorismate lyase